MLGRLLRLGLDQQRAGEADAVLVLDDELHETAELLRLAPEVGVEQSLVPLAPAPEHVVRAAETLGRLEHVLHLRRGVGEDLGIRVRGGAGGVARVTEQVRRAPEQLDAGPLHLLLDAFQDRVEVRIRLLQGRPLRRDDAVAEAEEAPAELREELEGDVELEPGERHRGARFVQPGPTEGSRTEDVVPGPGKAVPVADREAQVLLHALAEHPPIPVVAAERERALRIGTRVADRLDVRKERRTHRNSPFRLWYSRR